MGTGLKKAKKVVMTKIRSTMMDAIKIVRLKKDLSVQLQGKDV